MGNLDVNSKVPSDFEPLPIGGKGDLTIDETKLSGVKKRERKEKDTIEKSQAVKEEKPISSDQPDIDAPYVEKVTGKNLQKALDEIKTNPYFAKSFLAGFLNYMMEFLNLQQKMHFNEAQSEIMVRNRIYTLAKDSGKLQKELMNNQAQEQMIQAISSFANATVSATQFLQVTRNTGAAKRETEREIADKRVEIKDTQAKIDENQAKIDGAKLVPVGDNKEPILEKTKAADLEKLNKLNKELKQMEEGEHHTIQTKIAHKDQANQALAQTLTQTISGVSAVLTSAIKTDSGVKEEMQKIIEGFIQAMNKYAESLSKSRDDAAANYTRFTDFMNKIVESVSKSFYISGKA